MSRRNLHATLALAVGLTVAALLGGAAPAGAACGQEYRAAPAHAAAGSAPLAIGDSVLADAVPLLVRDGFEADGMVCRQMSQGLVILQERAATLPHLVVLALGTNGEVTPAQIDSALAIVGPQRVLALVTPHGSVVPSSPNVIREAAASHPGRIVLLDWDRLVAGHPDWLAADGVHLGGSAGIAAFAQLIASVLPDAGPTPTEGQAQSETEAPSETKAPSEPGTPITIQPPPGHRGNAAEQPAAAPASSAAGAAKQIPLGALRAFVAIVAAAAMPRW
jgi:hypothetical protein